MYLILVFVNYFLNILITLINFLFELFLLCVKLVLQFCHFMVTRNENLTNFQSIVQLFFDVSNVIVDLITQIGELFLKRLLILVPLNAVD